MSARAQSCRLSDSTEFRQNQLTLVALAEVHTVFRDIFLVTAMK